MNLVVNYEFQWLSLEVTIIYISEECGCYSTNAANIDRNQSKKKKKRGPNGSLSIIHERILPM